MTSRFYTPEVFASCDFISIIQAFHSNFLVRYKPPLDIRVHIQTLNLSNIGSGELFGFENAWDFLLLLAFLRIPMWLLSQVYTVKYRPSTCGYMCLSLEKCLQAVQPILVRSKKFLNFSSKIAYQVISSLDKQKIF